MRSWAGVMGSKIGSEVISFRVASEIFAAAGQAL
jgi:hypothetical protein